MNSDELRRTFLSFYESKGHLVIPSSSLIPIGDPTLLLTSAGVVQVKPFFTGEAKAPAPRLASCQKCFRTTDIDSVGDADHLTFFEMLGNFSVADYFKKEAIDWAWELVTERLKLPPEKLWVSVFLSDDESYELWRALGVPEERLVRYDESENWWGPPGDSGPCGPCTEIYYDFGEELSCGKPDCGPACDCNRFTEFYNLVLTEYYQDTEGNRTPLPSGNIDTGMGLERTAAIMQGVTNVYETDGFQAIMGKVSEVTGRTYGSDKETDAAMRVLAEHARGTTFLISDGVVPANEGRGYVLRRILRRAVTFARKLGVREPVLVTIAETVIENMREAYPDLERNREFILKVIEQEEARFHDTLGAGLAILDGMVGYRKRYAPMIPGVVAAGMNQLLGRENASIVLEAHGFEGYFTESDSDHQTGEALAAEVLAHSVGDWMQLRDEQGSVTNVQGALNRVERWANSLSKYEVFRLYDTYGFPPEITKEVAAEYGLSVDMEGFEREMEAQRARSRSAKAFAKDKMSEAYAAVGLGATRFTGYETLAGESVVVGLLRGGVSAQRVGGGEELELVTMETPFYAEGGGQVGDRGEIKGSAGRFIVEDTQATMLGFYVHRGRVVDGEMVVGDPVTMTVDSGHRKESARNHTATHLLHAALRQVLGQHVRQAGSLVAPDRLRFDFTHPVGLGRADLHDIRNLVNEKISSDLQITNDEAPYPEAISRGALAFFGDKYPDVVRLVSMGDGDDRFSFEVCGGTHVGRTGEVWNFQVTDEGSIGSGLRRIEAVTGGSVQDLLVRRYDLVEELSAQLKSPAEEIVDKVAALVEERDAERRRADRLERNAARREAEGLLGRVQDVDGARVVAARVDAPNVETMREMGDYLKAKLGSVFVVLASVINDRPMFIAMATSDLTAKGVHAGNIVKQVAKVAGGGGGGSPEMAQAGGKDKSKVSAALEEVARLVREGGS